MRNDIRRGAPMPWLPASWDDPRGFYECLWRALDERKTIHSKTQMFSSYALFHDLVGRHTDTNTTAFVHHVPSLGWLSLDYVALEQRTRALAARWLAAGVGPNSKIAIVLPPDAEWLTALLCALRVGCRVGWIPPHGKQFTHNRLRELELDGLVSHTRYAAFYAPWQDQLLTPPALSSPERSSDVGAYTYAPNQPVLDLFSSLGDVPSRRYTLTAETLYLGLLRDALLLLDLYSTDRVMACGLDPLQHQPIHLFTTMLAGATCVEGDLAALQDNEANRAFWPSVVGVTPPLRDQVLADEVSSRSWRLCYWDPGQPFDWNAWDAFARKLKTAGTAASMNFLSSAAAGGSLLWSPRHPQRMPLAVQPAPGVAWELRDMTALDQPTQGATGIYMPQPEGGATQSPGKFILSRFHDGFVFSGSQHPLTHGVVFPAEEVIGLVETHAEVEGASVVSQPQTDALFQHENTLLVFLPGATIVETGKLQLEMTYMQWIVQELGEAAKPDRIRFLPLYPRRNEFGQVDHDWCRSQFLDGTLERKVQDPIFLALSDLRRLINALTPEG